MDKILNGRVLLGIVFLLLGAVCLYDSYTADIIFAGSALGAMAYPRVLLYGWMILSLFYIIIPRKSFNARELRVAARILFKTMLNSLAFVILLPLIGFISSSFLFLCTFFYLLEDRNHRKIVIVSIVSTIVLWSIFEFVLNTPLPLGFWEGIFYSAD